MSKKAKIYYFSLTDQMKKQEKLDWFSHTSFSKIPFEKIEPDKNGNWINLTDNDFETLMPVCSKDVKNGKGGEAIFEFYSFGINTSRDEWVYDFSKENLANKMQFFIQKYHELLEKNDTSWDISIKWSEYLKNLFNRKQKITFDKKLLIEANYRPFTKQFFYAEKLLNDRLTQNHYDIFGEKLDRNTPFIALMTGAAKPFSVLLNQNISDLNYLSPAAGGTFCLPLYRYEKGEKKENITDWALEEFTNYYDLRLTEKTENQQAKIQKIDIFHYVYAVLHCPKYRQKYEQNLKRDFPRIPLYEDFWKWANFGKNLMDLHLNYENIEKYPLVVCEDTNNGKRTNSSLRTVSSETLPKPKLKANKELGEIFIDEVTTLTGVPAVAWDYKLGNRSALEWILDQYKESKPSDATILEKFNNYKFADYKEEVIELLQKVCTVSVRTMEIIGEM